MSAERDGPDRATYLEVVSRWADDLAHEIKNPLHAMVINLELVKRRARGGDPDAVVERTEIVEAELTRVHDLVDSLLRLVRPWPAAESVTADGIFGVLLPVFRARARIRRIEYAHSADTASVAVPPDHLARTLVTLVDRAIDGTPQGGRLSTAVTADGDSVTITVVHTRDDDPAPDDARFLAVRRLVEAAGGSAEVAVDGDESRTTVVLPRSGTV